MLYRLTELAVILTVAAFEIVILAMFAGAVLIWAGYLRAILV